MERTITGKSYSQSALQWDTLFAKIANTIDDMPLAKGNTSNDSHLGFEIITANRLKLGRNNQRSLVGPGMTLDLPGHLTRLLKQNKQIFKAWYQIFIDEIHALTLKPSKWQVSGRQPVKDDVVLFVFNDSNYHKHDRTWKLGIVTLSSPSAITIEYIANSRSKEPKKGSLIRNPRDVSILFSADDLHPNSNEHFDSINK